MVSERPKRTQFSSCDACRQARVACNATSCGYRPGDVTWSRSCSRCTERQCLCTFNWIKEKTSPVRRRPTRQSLEAAPIVVSNTSNDSHGASAGTKENEAVSYLGEPSSIIVHQPDTQVVAVSSQPCAPEPDSEPIRDESEAQIRRWCERIFDAGFGSVFRLWVGEYGCPIAQGDCDGAGRTPVSLFSSLDDSMEDAWHSSSSTVEGDEQRSSRRQRNKEMDDSLRHVIHAYAARWLPSVSSEMPHVDAESLVSFIHVNWRAVRQDMLRVINRISYRSALALFLFSQTHVPSGISRDEEMGGLNGFVCLQAALQQIQQLRLKIRSCQYYGSDVSAWSTGLMRPTASPVLDFRPGFVDLESRAYWATVAWDTAASVTLEVNSTLTSGLRGSCEEPAWVLARSYLVESFHPRTEEWRNSSLEVTDNVALEIISGAAVSRTYLWRTIASVKEALREGVDEDCVSFAWTAFQDAMRIFKTTTEPLMARCEKQLHFLSQTTRLNWYLMVLHHHLGVLMLVRSLEATDRSDLLPSVEEARLEAEHATLDVLSFGLKSKFTVRELESRSGSNPGGPLSPTGPDATSQRCEVSFIGIDPWPDHTLASIQFAYLAVRRRYQGQSISGQVYSELLSMLLQALEQLPQTSRSVSIVRQQMHRLVDESNVGDQI